MEPNVEYEKVNGAAIVTINNPPLNVMSSSVSKELLETFLLLEDDTEVVAVILTGAGSKAFMAGADIREFPSLIGKTGLKSKFLESHHVLNYIDTFSKPTIAVLNGITFGGGCELALACDIRIAENHVQIGLPEIKLGLFPGGGGTQRLPRLIGEARAKEMIFTGEPIYAEEAWRIGLVNKVVASGKGLLAAQEMAMTICQYSLAAISRSKQAIQEGGQLTVEAGLKREAELFEEVFQTADIKEGVKAFLEKRKPIFTHK
ncbi:MULTISPECIES: enoyl-CoA hydratase [Bacillaceae]|uniref:enoyl-CoA hydratase n=1 Tax=Bacillaceae TaxID=186817 RepID=UPI001BDE2FA0|nr:MULTISPECIES: enoyl-CoA hydratase [Bacillaceae]MDX8360220.1 enoyl-CoA hydratase [Cytobacillus sp. IB215316]